MTRSWVACGLALAVLGLAATAATAQNVTAFNPYNGVGLGTPTADNVRGYPVIDKPPPGGPAFNPWRPADVAAGWVSTVPAARAPVRAQTYSQYGAGASGPGSNLPPPPPGALDSRIVAVPLRGDSPGARRTPVAPPPMPAPPPAPEPPPSTAMVAPPPAAPAPVPITRAEAAPTPTPPPPASPPPAAAPAPPAPVVTAPPPPPPEPEPAIAKAAPPAPREPREPPPSSGPTVASVLFGSNSAEISDIGKADLDRVAKNITQQRMPQVDLRAFAGGADPTDARKVALARALAVRAYLIDQGVKARIEVGAFAAGRNSGPAERVDILAPGP